MCIKNNLYRAYLQYHLINNHKNKKLMLENWCKEFCKKQLCVEGERDLNKCNSCLKAMINHYDKNNNINQ